MTNQSKAETPPEAGSTDSDLQTQLDTANQRVEAAESRAAAAETAAEKAATAAETAAAVATKLQERLDKDDAEKAEKADDEKAPEVKLTAEQKKILKAIAVGPKGETKSAERIAGEIGCSVEEILRVADENRNGESMYDLAERLNVKVNDIFKAAGRLDYVRTTIKEDVDQDGNQRRRVVEEDYTEV
jgi:hypothetical protein